MKAKAIVIIIILTALILTGTMFAYQAGWLQSFKFPWPVSGEKTGSPSESAVPAAHEEVKAVEESKMAESGKEVTVRSQKEIWDEIHKMANTKIVAEEIWGTLEITAERVDGLILEITKSEYDDKEKLLEILARWKQGDFTRCVEDHNYVWEKLGGTVGKATGLKTN